MAKYRIGQMVDYRPTRLTIPASGREYKILRILPSDGNEHSYRIKTIAEVYERIAKESELALRASA